MGHGPWNFSRWNHPRVLTRLKLFKKVRIMPRAEYPSLQWSGICNVMNSKIAIYFDFIILFGSFCCGDYIVPFAEMCWDHFLPATLRCQINFPRLLLICSHPPDLIRTPLQSPEKVKPSSDSNFFTYNLPHYTTSMGSFPCCPSILPMAKHLIYIHHNFPQVRFFIKLLVPSSKLA